MTAGRALDALVAERVMGYKVVEEKIHDIDNFGDAYVVSKSSIYNYSTSIAAAWEVVERMRERKVLVIINDTGGSYRARFFTQQERWRIDEWVARPDEALTVWAATAPLAICLAAVKAMS